MSPRIYQVPVSTAPIVHVAEPAPEVLAHSRAEWGRLGRRLAAIQPAAVGRGLLAIVTALLVLAVVVGTWPALLPFVLGGVIAYAVLPAVDRLDPYMPRIVASILCVLAVVAAIVATLVVVLPPLALGVVRLVSDLPTRDEVDRAIGDLSAYLGSFPEGRAVLVPILYDAVDAIRTNLQTVTGDGGTLGRQVVGAFLGLAGAALTGVLALIVLPSWMLSVINSRRENRRELQTRIAASIRPDALAVVRIVDRVAAAYIRGFVVTGLAVAALTWLGIRLSEQFGVTPTPQPLPIAVFAGVTQLIPDIGPFFGFLPALILLPLAPDRAVAYLVIYVIARKIAGGLIGDRVMAPALNVHPAILVPAIVALSNLGLVWLFAAGPVVAITADLIRYVHGRLSDPPRPAGVLPHEVVEPVPAAPATAARVPVAYRAMNAR